MRASRSVRLGTSSALKFHVFSAAFSSVAASRPFKNNPTVRGEDKGAAKRKEPVERRQGTRAKPRLAPAN